MSVIVLLSNLSAPSGPPHKVSTTGWGGGGAGGAGNICHIVIQLSIAGLCPHIIVCMLRTTVQYINVLRARVKQKFQNFRQNLGYIADN